MGVFHLLARVVKHIDEHFADGLTLGLRVGFPCEGREESVSGTHPFHLQPHVFVARQHLFEFMLAQQPVVNENAVQLLADGPVQQGGSYR